MTYQIWYINISIVVIENFILKDIALVDSGADINCIKEGLVLTNYFDKNTQTLNTMDGSKLKIKFKLSNTYICNEGMCVPATFILIKKILLNILF